MVILPRQAWDKHRESKLTKETHACSFLVGASSFVFESYGEEWRPPPDRGHLAGQRGVGVQVRRKDNCLMLTMQCAHCFDETGDAFYQDSLGTTNQET